MFTFVIQRFCETHNNMIMDVFNGMSNIFWTLYTQNNKIGHVRGRGIMAARQLPKLKTRVRFPSPAPKIQSAFRRFNFCMWGWKRTRPRGFETERSAVKGAQQNHQERSDWYDFVWEFTSPSPAPKTINVFCLYML